jgi:amino acid adenylation domain-containing protein
MIDSAGAIFEIDNIHLFDIQQQSFVTLHELFEKQVIKTPQAIAIAHGNKKITYDELNNQANRLAYYLRKQGVKTDTFVGVCLGRSLDLVISFLGVLKAGGILVILDPKSPIKRLNYILNDTKLSILLTSPNLNSLFTSFKGNLVHIDRLSRSRNKKYYNLPAVTKAEDVAFVVYTSGSTGEPKGVLLQHSNFVNRLMWASRHYPFTPNDICCQRSPLSVVIAISEILGPLLYGVKLIILPDDALNNFEELIDCLIKNKITRISLVPAYLNALLQQYPLLQDKLPNLRHIEVGGERITYELVERFYKALPSAKLINRYGSTEAHSVLWFEFPPRCNPFIYPTIGKPISNTKVYILDKYLNPVPSGNVGELYIAGQAIALGYLGLSSFMKKVFLNNPFDNEFKYIYKTGDLVSFNEDGNILYVGRSDRQTKIHGFRVELDEIEANIRKLNFIKDVVVTTESSKAQQKSLVAYVVFKKGILNLTKVDLVGKLQKILEEALPEYMIPKNLVSVESIPLLHNGKIDYITISNLNKISHHSCDIHKKPGTPLEKELAKFWKELLMLNDIGVYDNFFRIGGSSLLAIQLISKIRLRYKVDISLVAFFKKPNIFSIAEEINRNKNTETPRNYPEIHKHQVPNNARFPVSFSQQRILFLDVLIPNKSVYNISLGFRLLGELEVNALEFAFNQLFIRHESLRTSFFIDDNQSKQVIAPRVSFILAKNNLTYLNKKNCEEIIKRAIQIEINEPFNLEICPLIRVKLLILKKKEHILLLTLHHIISDGLSIHILLRELSIIYNSYKQQKDASLPKLPIQYKDFSIWQREILNEDLFAKQLTYWEKYFADIPDCINLIISKTRPLNSSYKGGRYYFHISSKSFHKLKLLGRENNATLFMSLLTIFQILLYRYSNQEKILVGTPIANRNIQETDNVVGLFVNTLVLKAEINDEINFINLLSQVKETMINAYAYQDIPFEKIVDHLKIDRNLNRHPLFQVAIVLQNNYLTLPLENVKSVPLDLSNETAKFDLTLLAFEDKNDLKLIFEYAMDLFEEEMIARVAKHFTHLIDNILINPTQPIGKINLLTKSERYKLLKEWSYVDEDYTWDNTIHAVFEEKVKQVPNNVAIVYGNKKITYRHLNEESNRLANYLKQIYKVKPDTLIALCLDQNENLMIAILAILKAGGAYIPIDPDYPDSRIEYILKDTAAKIILSSEKYKNKLTEVLLPNAKQINNIFLDNADMQQLLRRQPITNSYAETTSRNLAYIIYTSGTTGIPKGVMQSHGNVLRLFSATNKCYQFNDSDTWVLFHSYVFDFSIWEIFGALIYGGKLIIPPSEHIKDLNMFYELCKRERVTVLNQTPSVFYQFKDIATSKDKSDKLTSLRYVIFGGEALSLCQLKSWFNLYANYQPKLINMYGITETTIHATYKIIEEKDLGKKSHIGKMIPDLKAYILDDNLNLLPIGAIGELYIGGAGLARGYLNQPQLTAERFIANPFQTAAEKSVNRNTRLYKTGDLVRWLADGNLEYIGRNDFQVKIRGYRIELGEIENVLSSYEGIKQSVVLVKEQNSQMDESREAVTDTSNTKYLVGYYVADHPLEEEDVFHYLSNRLPKYMIPSVLVHVEQMPLTINGKLDRKALLEPEFKNKEQYVAPRTELEKQVCGIWAEVLGLAEDKVGINDDFFRLGGNSILAIKLINRINRVLNNCISVEAIFNYHTISSLLLYHMQHSASVKKGENYAF